MLLFVCAGRMSDDGFAKCLSYLRVVDRVVLNLTALPPTPLSTAQVQCTEGHVRRTLRASHFLKNTFLEQTHKYFFGYQKSFCSLMTNLGLFF